MAVTAKKLQELTERMRHWGISASDYEEHFTRGGGKGGQKVNKTNNCVCLTHLPTGIVIRCHREREREINRYLARRALCDELEYRATGKKPVRKSSHRSPFSGITMTQRKNNKKNEFPSNLGEK